MADFTLPELGENVTTGDVLRVLVKPGDTVAKEQPVLELETDKATIEVPSSVAGVVTDVKVKVGDKVKVGQVILSVDGAGREGGAGRESRASGAGRAGGTDEAVAEDTADEETEARPVRAGEKVVDINRPSTGSGRRAQSEPAPPEMPPAPAAPSVRRMARELGVDINDVAGTEGGGRISIEDVKAHAKRLLERSAPAAPPAQPGAPPAAYEPTDAAPSAPPPARTASTAASMASTASIPGPLADFSRWGPIERQPMRAVRRKTAEHLAAAWATVPHVTQQDHADITQLEELRKQYAKEAETAGGTLTLTAIAVKVCATALKRFPQFNTSVDLTAEEIVFKKYINIGIAVDTDRGLLVPVIRDADTKSIMQLSVELAQLSERARSRKLTLEEMQGGTFSISNLGGIGGTFFTPIVNAPEVAILGISRARMEPVYESSQFVPRLMLPLSLSYDHRVIDGADGARFLRWVAEAFEQPFLLALHG